MVRLRRKPKLCPDLEPKLCPDLLSTMRHAGRSDWQCELLAGHDGPHERTTLPVIATWTTTARPGYFEQNITNLTMGATDQ